jgi:glycosyltransferase involved in cell wall biosynthesis
MNLLYSIPHYNSAKKLLRCLESIIKYKENDSLILIIDDYSNEDEVYLLKCSSLFVNLSKDKIIYFLTNDINQGPAFCRNKCIEFAIEKKISYISFIDADDYLINSIEKSCLVNRNIVFYDSAEILDHDKSIELNEARILKHNKFIFESLQKEILNYAIRPNQTNSLTSCWSKIYNTYILNNNNIRFNERMRTFEDVDFLIRYLNFVESYQIVSITSYFHTNNLNYKSATFGFNDNFNTLFGYLQVSRSLSWYFKKRGIYYNKYHFIICYFSITLIRIATKIRNLKQLKFLYKFIKKRINTIFIGKAITQYDAKLANGRPLIKFLIRFQLAFLLTIYVLIISRSRYKKEIK